MAVSKPAVSFCNSVTTRPRPNDQSFESFIARLHIWRYLEAMRPMACSRTKDKHLWCLGTFVDQTNFFFKKNHFISLVFRSPTEAMDWMLEYVSLSHCYVAEISLGFWCFPGGAIHWPELVPKTPCGWHASHVSPVFRWSLGLRIREGSREQHPGHAPSISDGQKCSWEGLWLWTLWTFTCRQSKNLTILDASTTWLQHWLEPFFCCCR